MISDIGRCLARELGRQVAKALPAAILAVLPVTVLPALGGENAILTSGFRIHADRHEVAGDSVKLFSGDGFTLLPISQIVSFEQEEYVAPPPTPAATPAVTPPATVAETPQTPP